MIVLLASSFLQHLQQNHSPISKFDRVVQAAALTSEAYNKEGKRTNYNNGPFTKHFIEKHIEPLENAQMVASVSLFNSKYKFITNNSKYEFNFKHTDENFFDICDFNFIEGRAYNKVEYERKDMLAVVDESTAKMINPNASAIGKYLEMYGKKYKVVGIVENVDATIFPVASNIYIPMSTNPGYAIKRNKSFKFCSALILAKTKNDFPKIFKELEFQSSKVIPDNDYIRKQHRYESKIIAAERLYVLLRSLTGMSLEDIKRNVLIVLSLLTTFFLLLPTVNLVNINKTRMAERSEEIGVRKSFGASRKQIAFQFLIENIFVTILGCLISVILSILALYFINKSEFIPNIQLSLYPLSILYSFIICVVLGFMSGVFPAIRMSKLQIAENIK
jgi:putative ABC transport system permease protein